MAKKTKTPVEGEETGQKKKGGKKKLFMIALVVIVLGGGAYVYMGMGKKPVAAATGGPPTTVKGALMEEDSLTVSLPGGHYLQFTAALQLAPGGSQAILTADNPIVLDILNTQAGAMTEPELLAPGGEAKLKAHILSALNQEWPGLVVAIYFEQYVMQ